MYIRTLLIPELSVKKYSIPTHENGLRNDKDAILRKVNFHDFALPS